MSAATAAAPPEKKSAAADGFKPYFVKVLWTYTAAASDEVSVFERDCDVEVLREEDEWLYGRSRGKLGVFPGNYVERIPDAEPDDDFDTRKKKALTPKNRTRASVFAIETAIAARRSSQKRRNSIAAGIAEMHEILASPVTESATNTARAFDFWQKMDNLVEQASAERLQASFRGVKARRAAAKRRQEMESEEKRQATTDIGQTVEPEVADAAETEQSNASHDRKEEHPQPTATDAEAEAVFQVGDRVEADYGGAGADYYPGQISKVYPDGTYDLAYDDGDIETHVPVGLIRRADSLPPSPKAMQVDDEDIRDAESLNDRKGVKKDTLRKKRKKKKHRKKHKNRLESTDTAHDGGASKQGADSNSDGNSDSSESTSRKSDSDGDSDSDSEEPEKEQLAFPEVESYTPYKRFQAAAKTTRARMTVLTAFGVPKRGTLHEEEDVVTGRPRRASVSDLVTAHRASQPAMADSSSADIQPMTPEQAKIKRLEQELKRRDEEDARRLAEEEKAKQKAIRRSEKHTLSSRSKQRPKRRKSKKKVRVHPYMLAVASRLALGPLTHVSRIFAQ